MLIQSSQPSVGSVWARGPVQAHWLYVYKGALLRVSSMMSDSEQDEWYWHLLYCNVLREVTQSKPLKLKSMAAASHRLFSAHHRQGARVHATGVQCAGGEVAWQGTQLLPVCQLQVKGTIFLYQIRCFCLSGAVVPFFSVIHASCRVTTLNARTFSEFKILTWLWEMATLHLSSKDLIDSLNVISTVVHFWTGVKMV